MNSGFCCWTSEKWSHWAADVTSLWDWRPAPTWIWDTTSSSWMWWWWQMRGTRTDPVDWTSECAGFRSEQSAERRKPGWRAGWADSYLEDRLSQQRWSISTSHKSSDSESPGWAASEAILLALGCTPGRLLGGQRLGNVDPFSCMTNSVFFLPTGLEDMEPWQIEEDRGTPDSGSLSLDV